jgi:hypothetical protein
MNLNAKLNTACAAFDIYAVDSFASLINTLDTVAKELAQSRKARSDET